MGIELASAVTMVPALLGPNSRELRAELEEIDQEQVVDELSARGVEWHFIPPVAP